MVYVKSKDSLDGKLNAIRDSFRSQISSKMPPNTYLYVDEIFDDYLVASGDGSYYRYTYSESKDGLLVFGSPEKIEAAVTWETVEKSVWNGDIAKKDSAEQNVYGWAYKTSESVGGDLILDKQNDFWLPDEIEKTANKYMLNSRAGDVMHLEKQVSSIIESVVFTPDKIVKMGLDPDTTPVGWWVGLHVDDKVAWEGVESGVWKMFSVGGKGVRRKVKLNVTD